MIGTARSAACKFFTRSRSTRTVADLPPSPFLGFQSEPSKVDKPLPSTSSSRESTLSSSVEETDPSLELTSFERSGQESSSSSSSRVRFSLPLQRSRLSSFFECLSLIASCCPPIYFTGKISELQAETHAHLNIVGVVGSIEFVLSLLLPALPTRTIEADFLLSLSQATTWP